MAKLRHECEQDRRILIATVHEACMSLDSNKLQKSKTWWVGERRIRPRGKHLLEKRLKYVVFSAFHYESERFSISDT